MKLRYELGLVAAAGLTVLAALSGLSGLQADEPPKPEQPAKAIDVGSPPEVQDVVFFTEKRPVLLRMRLFIDGKPASERWEAFQKKFFEYLDVDGDGFLSKEEAARVLSAGALTQFFAGNPFLNNQPGLGTPASTAPAFEELDTNKDGKVSPEELVAYYRRLGAGPPIRRPTGPPGISARHCFIILADWRTSSTRTMNRS